MPVNKKIKNLSIYPELRFIAYLFWIYPREVITQCFRRVGLSHRYDYLKKYKGIHSGKRCFILATGPSLREGDYLKLENEYTFGINAICLWFKKMNIETDYFVVSEDEVYDRIKDALIESSKTTIFISQAVADVRTVFNKAILFPVNLWNRFVLDQYKKRMSNDISVTSDDEITVVFHAIQIAAYMGFSEIYLLGADCDYTQKKNYAIDHGKKNTGTEGPKIIQSYEVAKRYEDKLGIHIYNATRGGKLEVFPRVDIDDLLSVKKD